MLDLDENWNIVVVVVEKLDGWWCSQMIFNEKKLTVGPFEHTSWSALQISETIFSLSSLKLKTEVLKFKNVKDHAYEIIKMTN